MPKTLLSLKRIQRLCAEGNHDRCTVDVCPDARIEYDALTTPQAADYPADWVDDLEVELNGPIR